VLFGAKFCCLVFFSTSNHNNLDVRGGLTSAV